MAITIHREGQEDILKDYFQGQAAHATLYLGLADTGGAGFAETDGISAVAAVELAGTGYARVALTVGATDFPVALNAGTGRYEVTYNGDFTAGADWTEEADTWFLVTSADGTGKLVMSGLKTTPRTLTNGSSLNQEVAAGLDNAA